MKVKELIEILGKHDPEQMVLVRGGAIGVDPTGVPMVDEMLVEHTPGEWEGDYTISDEGQIVATVISI